jgi:carboxypeptidase Q
MKIKRFLSLALLLSIMPAIAFSQLHRVYTDVIDKIRHEGTENSMIEDLSFWFTDFSGPRLTASDGGDRGNEVAANKMREFGFQNVRIEYARDFTRGGWDNLKTYVAMTEPYYSPFTANPVAWTGSTPGAVVSEVILLDIQSEEDLEKYRGKLRNKIVIQPSSSTYRVSFSPLATRWTEEQLEELTRPLPPREPQQRQRQPQAAPAGGGRVVNQMALRTQITELINEEKPAVILRNSGSFNVPRSTGVRYTQGEPEPQCEVALPVEAFGKIQRLLQYGIPVKMEVEITNKFNSNNTVYNVIGEIPGSDPTLKEEIVILGGHIDAWHGSTGAADNASGCIVMVEAARILLAIDAKPRRTIKVALWGGEEQGLHGSRGYVEQFLWNNENNQPRPGYDKFQIYLNMDNGTGRYRGIYTEGNEGAMDVFKTWLAPFADMEATTVSPRNTGSTDHVAFNAVGLPGFQFIQDRIEYGRGYHTIMDTYDRLIMDDLRQNAIITASLAYHAAMMNEKFPRVER